MNKNHIKIVQFYILKSFINYYEIIKNVSICFKYMFKYFLYKKYLNYKKIKMCSYISLLYSKYKKYNIYFFLSLNKII
ncbi:hypothetical protein [Candidatus Vidania fulgoroideorum]